MRVNSFVRTAGVGIAALCVTMSATGCDFNPINYMSRNACDFLNCNVLFFVDDLLPLSGGPIASSGAAAEADSDDGGGGHAH